MQQRNNLKTPGLFRCSCRIGALLLFVQVFVTPTLFAQETQPKRWSFSAGVRQLGNVEMSLSGGTPYSAQFIRSGGRTVTSLNGAGPANAFADRDYDDGYVYRDIGTENPAAVPRAAGVTWYYEYQNPAQWNAGADTLTFTRAGASSTASQGGVNPFSGNSEESAEGIQLRLDYVLMERPHFGIRAVLSGAWFPEQETHMRWTDYTATRRRTSFGITDTYNLQGVDPSIRQNPAPDPAAGSWLYDAPNPGDPPRPVIDNMPSSRALADGPSVRQRYFNDVNYQMDYDIATFGLGLEFEWVVHERISLYVSPRIEQYRLDMNASRTETLRDGAGQIAGRWRDTASEQDVIWGGVLETGVKVALTEKWFVRLHGDALKTWDHVEVQTGPTEMTMDLSCWSWGCDLGVRF